MGEIAQQNRRRNYFIDKRFQALFIIKFCILVILGTVISGAIIYAVSRTTLTTSFVDARLQVKTTADFILPSVILSGAVVVVAIGLATIAVTLFTSHRIAGPLYRLDKDVQEIVRGNLTVRFHLRQHDELKALAQDLDQMVLELRSDMIALQRLVDELAGEIGERGDDVMKRKVTALQEMIREFKTT